MKATRFALFLIGVASANAWGPQFRHVGRKYVVRLQPVQVARRNYDDSPFWGSTAINQIKTSALTTGLALGIGLGILTLAPASSEATDPASIVGCLFQKCQVPLLKCIANPKCLANVVCINTCNNRPDEIDCQIQCGNLWENDVVGEFNKCAVSDMSCVLQKPDDGSYPVPREDQVVPAFDTKLWNGRWYITAGQNKLFDIFPCQVHFFVETEPGKFFAKINWRIEEPDGEFFTRNALQEFYQDPKQPSHLINHDNEYLHYKDDWYIVDYEYDNNPSKTPPFAFVYYRGSNDAWDGYGGVVVYTRDATLPTALLPRLRAAAQKVGFDFDKDFTITDNSCPTEQTAEEKRLLREKFAGKVVLQTEQQLQTQATLLRGNAFNSIKAQKLLLDQRLESAEKAFEQLEQNVVDFEKEVVGGLGSTEQRLESAGKSAEEAIEKVEQNVLEFRKEVVEEIATELQLESLEKSVEKALERLEQNVQEIEKETVQGIDAAITPRQ